MDEHPMPKDTVYYSFVQTHDLQPAGSEHHWVMGPRFVNKEERDELLESLRVPHGMSRHPIIITTTHVVG